MDTCSAWTRHRPSTDRPRGPGSPAGSSRAGRRCRSAGWTGWWSTRSRTRTGWRSASTGARRPRPRLAPRTGRRAEGPGWRSGCSVAALFIAALLGRRAASGDAAALGRSLQRLLRRRGRLGPGGWLDGAPVDEAELLPVREGLARYREARFGRRPLGPGRPGAWCDGPGRRSGGWPPLPHRRPSAQRHGRDDASRAPLPRARPPTFPPRRRPEIRPYTGTEDRPGQSTAGGPSQRTRPEEGSRPARRACPRHRGGRSSRRAPDPDVSTASGAAHSADAVIPAGSGHLGWHPPCSFTAASSYPRTHWRRPKCSSPPSTPVTPGSLSIYLAEINHYSLLKVEEEQKLARRFHQGRPAGRPPPGDRATSASW